MPCRGVIVQSGVKPQKESRHSLTAFNPIWTVLQSYFFFLAVFFFVAFFFAAFFFAILVPP